MYKTKVVVKSRGEVIWNAPVTWKISCSSDVTWFPIDEQVCEKVTLPIPVKILYLKLFGILPCDLRRVFSFSQFLYWIYIVQELRYTSSISYISVISVICESELWLYPPYVWCSGQHYITTLFSKVWKSFSQRVGCFHWWESLTMFPAGNKTKGFSSVIHSKKTIHHHHVKASCRLYFYMV